MKKKGLIISTVVMVVVLVASLTTATFAWFTTTATATVRDLQVQTESAKGLQIATFALDSSDANTKFKNGETSYTSGNWTGAISGWGQSLDFQQSTTKFMGVSGDGLAMYALNDPKAAFASGTLDKSKAAMKNAEKNVDYFVAYIALRNEETEAQDVKVDTITVAPVTDTNNTNSAGMVASLRIAIFTKTDASKDVNTTSVGDADLTARKLIYLPFADYKFEDGEWKSYAGGATNNYLSYDANDPKENAGAEFADKTTTMDKMKTNALSEEQTDATENTCSAMPSDPFTKTLTGATLAENVAAHGVIYLKLVIWFEGEDAECISLFAGGGAKVNITFGQTAHPGE